MGTAVTDPYSPPLGWWEDGLALGLDEFVEEATE
jgi:hypothetical protein